MGDKNPYTPPQAETAAPLTIRFSDPLPPVCMVCGATATGVATMAVAVPSDAASGILGTVQFLAKRVSFVTAKHKYRVTPSSNVLRLPHCDQHGDNVRTAISVRPINHLKVEVDGAAPAFCEALAALLAPPSPEMLAAMDAGPERQRQFLQAIEKSSVSSPNDFLQGLERDERSP